MKYKFYEIGKQMRLIETSQPFEQKEIETLMKTEDLSFLPLKNGHTICVDGEGVIKNLPYNRTFGEKDTTIDIGDGIRGNILEGKLIQEEFVGFDI